MYSQPERGYDNSKHNRIEEFQSAGFSDGDLVVLRIGLVGKNIYKLEFNEDSAYPVRLLSYNPDTGNTYGSPLGLEGLKPERLEKYNPNIEKPISGEFIDQSVARFSKLWDRPPYRDERTWRDIAGTVRLLKTLTKDPGSAFIIDDELKGLVSTDPTFNQQLNELLLTLQIGRLPKQEQKARMVDSLKQGDFVVIDSLNGFRQIFLCQGDLFIEMHETKKVITGIFEPPKNRVEMNRFLEEKYAEGAEITKADNLIQARTTKSNFSELKQRTTEANRQIVAKLREGDSVQIGRVVYTLEENNKVMKEMYGEHFTGTAIVEFITKEEFVRLAESGEVKLNVDFKKQEVEIKNPDIGKDIDAEKNALELINAGFFKSGEGWIPHALEKRERAILNKYSGKTKEVLEEIITSPSAQRARAICYFVSALQEIKYQDPEMFLQTSARSIRIKDGKVQARVLGLVESMSPEDCRKILGDKDGWISVDSEVLNSTISTYSFSDQASIYLEYAFRSTVSRIKNSKKGSTESLDERGLRPYEEGNAHRALHWILSSEVAQKVKIGKNQFALRLTDELRSAEEFVFNKLHLADDGKLPEYFVTLSSPFFMREEDGSEKGVIFGELQDGKNYIIYKHSYPIISVQGSRIQLTNIQNSVGKPVEITRNDFGRMISSVQAVKIKKRYPALKLG